MGAPVRLGISDHLGWAVAVVAGSDHEVVDRRRIELVEAGMPNAPIHHRGGAHPLHGTSPPIDDSSLAELVADVQRSAVRTTSRSLAEIAATGAAIVSISLRRWPEPFPDDVAVLRRPPFESRADAVMYRRVLAEVAEERGWAVHLYDAKLVEDDARRELGDRAEVVLDGPRRALGPPWTKDHRVALAATVIAGRPTEGAGA